MSPTLTPHQSVALAKCQDFLHRPNASKVFVLSGYAGTGKTTLLTHLSGNYSFCAPTGKAAQVLASKGIPATTIHSLIYEPLDTFPVSFRRRDELKCSAIIIDEASMVSTDILNDLLKFRLPLLFVGDPFQLPPVGIDPFLFTRYPGTSLTEVHRQALDNPIISLATHLRLNSPSAHPRNWKSPDSSGRVIIQSRKGIKIDPTSIDQCIVGYNNTRRSVNRAIRNRIGFTDVLPHAGDRLICLRNNYERGVINGQQFISLDHASLTDNELDVTDPVLNKDYSLEYYRELFTDPANSEQVRTLPRAITPIDYAYAITCHKAQGSEFNHVAIIDEPIGDDPNRWRYTAVTRAKERLTYFI